jgi:hypothetical protein
MASRLTTNQEIAGSTPAVVICFFFPFLVLFGNSHLTASVVDAQTRGEQLLRRVCWKNPCSPPYALKPNPSFPRAVALNRASRDRVRVPRSCSTYETHVHVAHAGRRKLRRRRRLDWVVVGSQ